MSKLRPASDLEHAHNQKSGLATMVADALPDSFWIDLIFYPLAGILWGVPLIPLLKWAERG